MRPRQASSLSQSGGLRQDPDLLTNSLEPGELSLDARQIHAASRHLLARMFHRPEGWQDWRYVGIEGDFRITEVSLWIERCFGDSRLILSHNRKVAVVLDRPEIAIAVRDQFAHKDVLLTHEGFDALIQFDRAGVARYGSALE